MHFILKCYKKKLDFFKKVFIYCSMCNYFTKKMKKKDLSVKIKNKFYAVNKKILKKDVEAIIDMIFATILDELKETNYCFVSNFGTFKLKEPREREMVLGFKKDKKGEKVKVRQGYRIAFKKSKKLEEFFNN